MVNLNPSLSIIILNVNGQNILIKSDRKRLVESLSHSHSEMQDDGCFQGHLEACLYPCQKEEEDYRGACMKSLHGPGL